MSAHMMQPLLAAPPVRSAGQPQSDSSSYVQQDQIDDHILRPNAFSVNDIVARVNGGRGGSSSWSLTDLLCCSVFGCCGLGAACCGRVFTLGVGNIALWLDETKRPMALEPNQWHLRPNWMQTELGEYDMSSDVPFRAQGICLAKIEAGSVYFAHQGGTPVMIAAKERSGWFVSTDPGFSFAKEIVVDGIRQYDCKARLASAYLSFESLHLFNVQPNTVHVVSNYVPGVGNQWQVLPPGSHSFSSPFMRSTAVIATSIQDLIITEDRVSTQDGIQLTQCKAVLSYQIRMENVHKLLSFDVSNYRTIIEDWSALHSAEAKRTMLHEISCMDYQNHQAPVVGEADERAAPKSSTILGSKFSGAQPAAGTGVGDGFRPTLEQHMHRALEVSLSPYGVDIKTFALQSFDPPPALAAQLTTALARRTEARYQFEAQQINNQTLIGQAETEATAIRTRAAAVAKAAELTASVPHARALQILDKQVEIARAWANGRATTLVLGSGMPGTGGGAGPDMGAGPGAQSMNMPLTTLSEMAGGIMTPSSAAGSAAAPSTPFRVHH